MNSTIGSLGLAEFSRVLKTSGVTLKTGPFSYHIKSSLPAVQQGLHLLYADYALCTEAAFADFHISMNPVNSLRRWVRPKIHFCMDHKSPFLPMPLKQGLAFMEWGMNWCISNHVNDYVKLHAAVLEKNGRALIMPGAPGAGKSTLSAALTLRGWRLLSDEHALVSLTGAMVTPLCRPVGLKNASIEVIKGFDSGAVIGPLSEDTHKGTVAHLKADLHSDSQSDTPVKAAWVIFPRYSPGSSTRLEKKQKAETFLSAAKQSFNYSLLGERGYQSMVDLISACDCYDFVYSNLNEAIETFNNLKEPV